MGSFFVEEFGDELRKFRGTRYAPVARLAGGQGPGAVLGFGPDLQAVVLAFSPPRPRADLARRRIQDTAELINALNSPHLARHFEAGEADGSRLWVAAGYVPGPSLPEAVERYGPLRRESVRQLAQGLIEVFEGLHRAGLGGRGLEPEDLVLGRSGPVLVDPGLARVEGVGGLIEAGGAFESWSNSVAADVRAIGAVLYFAVTGRPAFPGCGDILSPALGDCPNALREAIEASQRARPEARPSLAELARAANEGGLAASLSAHWLEEPWQSPDVLREINERAKAVAALRERFIDLGILAAAAPPLRSFPLRVRENPVHWAEPGEIRAGGVRGAWRTLAAARRQWHDRHADRG